MEIRPFNGLRYRVSGGDVSAYIAPPYDILSQADKDRLLAQDPANIVAADLPQVPPSQAGADELYARSARLLEGWRQRGLLARDSEPSLYVYEQEFAWAGKDYRRRTLIALVRLAAFGQGVWPHEKTFPGPKADRLKLTQFCQAQLSPIFGFYEPEAPVTQIVNDVAGRPADQNGRLGGVGERLWVISQPDLIARIQQALVRRDLFIADGHHRYTTALNYRDSLGQISPEHPANFCMFVLAAMDDPGLIILPTHRIISGLKGFSLPALVAQTAPAMDWRQVEGPLLGPACAGRRSNWQDADALLKPFGPRAFGFVGKDGTAQVGRVRDAAAAMDKLAPDQPPAWRELDVSVLHKLVIEQQLKPWWTDQASIAYAAQTSAALAPVEGGAADLAVFLQATPLEAVCRIARAGSVMPHKSTYFYPKPATGMVMYAFGG